MSETTPDPADVHTGTDRVELTDAERASLNCDCVKYDGSHYDICFVPAVESIVAARVQALTAEVDGWRKHYEDTYRAWKNDKADRHSSCVALEQRRVAERDAARAELTAANARCAELEAERDDLRKISLGWTERGQQEFDRAEALQATLDRVAAFIETWSQPHSCAKNNTAQCVPCRMLRDLRAALTPEGTE